MIASKDPKVVVLDRKLAVQVELDKGHFIYGKALNGFQYGVGVQKLIWVDCDVQWVVVGTVVHAGHKGLEQGFDPRIADGTVVIFAP